MNCNICPRKCNINRSNKVGYCKQSEKVRISKVMLHHYEEPIISGEENDVGSGAIFFTGCNLQCVYCQNEPISHRNKGKNISIKKLAKIFKKLERKGAFNINLVTPTHFTEQILKALEIYKPKIPIVWNSSGYETEETIKRLKDVVDIYLVDLKYMEDDIAKKYSNAPNYSEFAKSAIKQMKINQPTDVVENSLMKKGLIIRHLVLPTHTENSLKCLKFINDEIGKDTIVSIMSQYEPRYNAVKYPEINRKITPLEYKRVINYAVKNNMDNCFTQDLSSANSKYTPKF